MSEDPILRVAKLRVVRTSAELEAQLLSKDGGAPAIYILRKLQARATESLAALAIADPFKPQVIMTLQNEVKRYDEWFVAMVELVNEGKAYDQEMTAADRDEILDMLSQSPEGQREALELGLMVPDSRHN